VAVGGDGHALVPSVAMTAAGGRNQSPSNCAGTGPPGGGDAAGDGLEATDGEGEGVFADEVDWLQDEAKATNVMPSSEAIAGEPIQRSIVKTRRKIQHDGLRFPDVAMP
jgi:hypothetical protein